MAQTRGMYLPLGQPQKWQTSSPSLGLVEGSKCHTIDLRLGDVSYAY